MSQQPICQFSDRLTTALSDVAPRPDSGDSSVSSTPNGVGLHSHDGGMMMHTHGGDGTWTPDEHGHTHEHLEHAGRYSLLLAGRGTDGGMGW